MNDIYVIIENGDVVFTSINDPRHENRCNYQNSMRKLVVSEVLETQKVNTGLINIIQYVVKTKGFQG